MNTTTTDKEILSNKLSKWDYSDIPDLTGKVAIVTGANSGLGYETARALAANGAKVIMACRSKQKAEAAIRKIQTKQPKANLQFVHIDLADFSSINEFATKFSANHEQLDILVNNAGVMNTPFKHTTDGLEWQMGINYFSPFYLTNLLIPKLKQSETSRVVMISSIAANNGDIHLSDLNFEQRDYNGWKAYSQSKLADLMFAIELQRRLTKANIENVTAFAAHPGVSSTDLFLDSVKDSFVPDFLAKFFISLFLKPFAQSPRNGAKPQIFAATSTEAQPGSYYGPGGWRELKGDVNLVNLPDPALDDKLLSKLWVKTEQLLDIDFQL